MTTISGAESFMHVLNFGAVLFSTFHVLITPHIQRLIIFGKLVSGL